MTDKKNIFNLENQSDLPDFIKGELQFNAIDKTQENIEHLLKEAGRELSIDEIIVGMFRMFDVEKPRSYWRMTLYNYSRSSKSSITRKKNRKGYYEYK